MGKESKKVIIGIVAKHREEDKDLIRQDSRIRDEVKQAIFDNYVHPIFVNKNSKFYQTIKAKETMVNSRHRRFVEKCPKLDKVGFCDDNYPDVIESKNKKFYIGVRFHPESLYKKDDKMNNIFKEFIVSCRKND